MDNIKFNLNIECVKNLPYKLYDQSHSETFKFEYPNDIDNNYKINLKQNLCNESFNLILILLVFFPEIMLKIFPSPLDRIIYSKSLNVNSPFKILFK